MGVRGLFLHCSEKHPGLAEYCDLISVAQRRNGIEIIVDFYAFEYWILQQMSILLSENEINPWVELCGGEYSAINSLITSAATLFLQAKIRPVFVMDGAKFSTNAQANFKYNEWVRRDLNDYSRCKKMLEMVNGAMPLGSMNRREYVRPVLVELEMISCLKSLGIEIYCCCSGEADMYIAKLFAERKAFAIITNDSDFLLFPNCSMISIDSHLDVDKDLRKTLVQAYHKGVSDLKLSKLGVKCVLSNKVHAALRLETIDQVCDFAFVRGNDASKHFTDAFHSALNISPNNFSGLVNYIHQNQPLTKEKTFVSMCSATKGFREAYDITHAFYKLDFSRLPVDEEHVLDKALENFICVGVSRLNLSPNILAISRGFHWCRVLVEEVKFNNFAPVSEVAMAPFRAYLYQMSLSRSSANGKAIEFSVLPRIGMKQYEVDVPQYNWLPKLNHISDLTRKERLEIFHIILSSLDTGSPVIDMKIKFYVEFPWPEAFRVYVCRYFLLLNHRRNLHVSYQEMLAIIACVFGCNDSNIILTHSTACKPSNRTLTLSAWLQNVYRYAFGFLAQMLQLEENLPYPSSFFSGAVFTAFYYCDKADMKNIPLSDPIRRISNTKTAVLREYNRAVSMIISNCY